jgi:spermidine synthase
MLVVTEKSSRCLFLTDNLAFRLQKYKYKWMFVVATILHNNNNVVLLGGGGGGGGADEDVIVHLKVKLCFPNL